MIGHGHHQVGAARTAQQDGDQPHDLEPDPGVGTDPHQSAQSLFAGEQLLGEERQPADRFEDIDRSAASWQLERHQEGRAHDGRRLVTFDDRATHEEKEPHKAEAQSPAAHDADGEGSEDRGVVVLRRR